MPDILVIDDSLTVRELINLVLTSAGFQVRLAEDGAAALTEMKARKPDLILTDFHMPNLGGFDLIQRVRAMPRLKRVPILVLTNEAAPLEKERTRAAGANGWIVKPFNPAQLIDAVRRVLPAEAGSAEVFHL